MPSARSLPAAIFGLIVALSAASAPTALAQDRYRVRGKLKAVAGDPRGRTDGV